mgnify:CR=1 FL=1
MKAKTFENLIRKVVREEIDYSLRREIKTLKEDLRDELKPTIVEHTKRPTEVLNNPQTPKTSLKEKIMGNTPLKERPRQNYTSNNSLNDLLNETAQGDTNTQTATAPSIMESAEIPQEVAEAVTRDYSGLMKAIAKKKGR